MCITHRTYNFYSIVIYLNVKTIRFIRLLIHNYYLNIVALLSILSLVPLNYKVANPNVLLHKEAFKGRHIKSFRNICILIYIHSGLSVYNIHTALIQYIIQSRMMSLRLSVLLVVCCMGVY